MLKNITYVWMMLLTLGCMLITSPTISHAEDPADFDKEIEASQIYMNNLKTARARFVQTNPDGSQAIGTFYISRPGKLRFEYDDPIEDFVVADGFFIYFYDGQLQEQINMPIGQSLADFILRKRIEFTEDVIVSDVQRGGDLMQIKLVQQSDPLAGSLTLAFSENPMQLKKWRIVDPQNLVTEIELFYLKENVELDDDLFVYTDPTLGQEPHYND